VLHRVTILAMAALGSLGAVSAARAQSAAPFSVDVGLADQGKKVWKSKSCDACHTIGGGKRAGPDLAGLLERRSPTWVAEWLKHPQEMAGSDSVAKQMVKDAQGIVMPDFRLTDQQVQGLIHYMAREGRKG
jgi:mono/diheme cytochrome c family protein